MPSPKIINLIKDFKKADLLKDLIWPAVAGNVAWTFFSVLLTMLQPKINNESEVPIGRLIATLLLSCYLGIVYLMACYESKEEQKNKKNKIDWFDIFHSLTIILCAISFQLRFSTTFCNYCLTVFWGVAAVGHLTGAWTPVSVVKCKFVKQLGMTLISITGICLCLCLSSLPNNWNLVISLFTGLVLWGCLRNIIYE